MKLLGAVLSLLVLPLTGLPAAAQNPPAPKPDAWQSLSFLEGTWDAKTTGSSGVEAGGSYTFRRELEGHVLARHSRTDAGCKGPENYDCEHGDLLYVYEEAPGQPVKAIYFDNEGHVIHYDVSTPALGTVVFLSEGSRPGPQFRLAYELKDSVMSGRFQMRMPGQTEWRSYLEWSGRRK
jgi:uncharacterized protein YaiE (UPF0345 family)